MSYPLPRTAALVQKSPNVTTMGYIDRYEVRARLGQGAMGAVYLAFDPKLHREVAIKVLHDQLAKEPKIRERFQREARAVAAVRHPNIVEIHDYSGDDSKHLYLVMERLSGENLERLVKQHGRMPEPLVAAIGHELCLALSAAHQAGIIHRDLKPDNAFLDVDGRVVLTDFGVVKAIRDQSVIGDSTRRTEIIGTPGYMAPELMLSAELGPFTDVYALGAMLYRLITGELPFEGQSPTEVFKAAMKAKYKSPRDFDPLISEEICAVIDACLRPKAKDRLQSPEAARQALKLVLGSNGVTDLRDDLREYMRDPATYTASVKKRSSAHLLVSLKLAVKDRNEGLARSLHNRLLAYDDKNEEVQAMTGVVVGLTPSGDAKPSRAPILLTARKKKARWPVILVGGGVLAVALVTGYVVWSRMRATPVSAAAAPSPVAPLPAVSPVAPPLVATLPIGNTVPVTAPLPSASPSEEAPGDAPASPVTPAPLTQADVSADVTDAFVEVRLPEGNAPLFVDGKWRARLPSRVSLKSNKQQLLEVRYKGKKARTLVTPEPGQLIELVPDFDAETLTAAP